MTAEATHEQLGPSANERLLAFRAQLDVEALQAPERPMRAFFIRSAIEFDNNPVMLETVEKHIKQNPDDSPATSVNLLFRAAQRLVIPPLEGTYPVGHPYYERDPQYPRGRHNPTGWDDVFELISHSPAERFFFESKFIFGRIQSNIYSRGAPVRAAIGLLGIQDVILYSGGDSIGLVEKMMGLHDGQVFKYPPVSAGLRLPEHAYGYEKSPTISRKLNQLIRNPDFSLNRVIGVDLAPPTDPLELDWARSCSFRPNEFRKRKHRDKVQLLIMADFPAQSHIMDDYSALGHVERLHSLEPGLQKDKPNIALFSFSLYQNTVTERAQALANAEQIVDQSEGVIAILDFVKKSADGELIFDSGRNDWDVNLFIKDLANKDAGWQHIFSAREGRARELALGESVTRLAFGALRS